jgi:serine/threonine protein kinase
VAHDPRDVEQGRDAIARGLLDKTTALKVLERATAERCGFVEAARRTQGIDPRVVAALAAAPPASQAPAFGSSPASGFGSSPASSFGSSPGPASGIASSPGPTTAPRAPAPLSLSRSSERDLLPPIGTTLAGYRLEKLLGRGGMGGVYIGVNESGARRAVKIPIFTGDQGDEWRKRFEREANSVARLKAHPNVIRVHGAGVDGQWAWCTLELIEGESLDDMVKRGPLPVDRALDLVEQLARALAHIHEAGIVHRDVKPANVMVRSGEGTAVLMDFGLARDMSERERLTQSGVLLGTPAYAAPEQLEGRKDVDARADIYAAGAVLYELLTGSRPFEGDSQVELMKHVLLDDPKPLSSFRKDVPPGLETIIQRAMAKERISRYKTADLLADDLARLRRGDSIRARKITFDEKLVARWRRVSRRSKIALASIVALGLLSAAGFEGHHLWSVHQRKVETARAELATDRGALAKARRTLLAELAASENQKTIARVDSACAKLVSRLDEGKSLASSLRDEVAASKDELTRADLAIAVAKDKSDARNQLEKALPDEDLDRRVLDAVLSLRQKSEKGYELARSAAAAIPRDKSAPDRFYEVLACLVSARVDLATKKADAADRDLKDARAAGAAELGLEWLLVPLEGQALKAQLLEKRRDQEERRKLLEEYRSKNPTLYPEVAAVVVGNLLEKKPPDASARELVRFIYQCPGGPGVFHQHKEFAPTLLEWCATATADAKPESTIDALDALEAAQTCDPATTPPDSLNAKLKDADIAYRTHDDARKWIDLLIGKLRIGLNPELAEDTGEFIQKNHVCEQLRGRIRGKDPKEDWPSRLALAFVLDVDAEDVDRQRGRGKMVSLLDDVLSVLEGMDPPPAALPTARNARADALVASTVDDNHTEAEDRAFLVRAAVDLDAIIKADDSRKPEEAFSMRALIHFALGEHELALAASRKAVEAADDRARRSLIRDATERERELARGRRSGRPLEPTDPRRESASMTTRRQLVCFLIELGRVDEALKVADEFKALEAKGEGIAARWRPIVAIAHYARGTPEDVELASKLLDEDLRTTLMVKTELENTLKNLAAILVRTKKLAQRDVVVAKLKEIMSAAR